MSETIHTLINSSYPEAVVVEGDFPLDGSVVAVFPEGTKFLSAVRYNFSAWTITARLATELPNGCKEQYFIKCASEELGRIMMEGEFNGMSELHKTMPNLAPKPHSWGKYLVGNPDTYFFVQQFIEMVDGIPESSQLCTKLASLHRSSVSPTGKFGFHITTCQGRTPQAVVPWESTWTNLFARMLQHVIDLDFKTNGHWAELDNLAKRIFSHVIPRLIGNLERDGRSIKPCLIHGDLWEGNIGTVQETGDIYIYDS
jgi:protein-ribulosamine 3-kinase